MKILIVSDDNGILRKISEKLVLLRSDDEIYLSSYAESAKFISDSDIVLVHENSDISNEFISEIKRDKSIIFVANNLNSVLKAIDSGADDYILLNANSFEYVIRITNIFKVEAIKNNLRRNCKLLVQSKIIDEDTGIYRYSDQTINNLSENLNGVLIAMSPKDKTSYSSEKITKIIKNSTRACDILTFGKGTNFYLILPDTSIDGAINVYNKINQQYEMYAGLANLDDNAQEHALSALSDAVIGKNNFVVFDRQKNVTLDDWLVDEQAKGYKLYRSIFNKKLEKVITPVFYRLQKTYEERIFDTKIEQYINNDVCVFALKNKKYSSELQIIYPGFSKIIILIKHEGLDSPENKEIQLQLSKVTQDELVEIVEDFIKEFKGLLKC